MIFGYQETIHNLEYSDILQHLQSGTMNCRPKENNTTALFKTIIEKINSGNLIM